MQKYVTSLKELVELAIPNLTGLESEANKENPKACFQLGMIYLLGINTKFNFPLAEKFFGNPCLAEDPNAIRMIGFIHELNGKIPLAFESYAKAESLSKKEELQSSNYMSQILDGRYKLYTFLNELGLFPNFGLNKIITSVINDYYSGDYSGDNHEKVENTKKLAVICCSPKLCYEVARQLYEIGDYFAASQWINRGCIPSEDTLSRLIADRFLESKRLLETMNYVSTKEKIIDTILHDYFGKHIFILASLVQKQKGHYRELFEDIRRKGYLRIRVDGQIRENTQGMRVDRYKLHDIEAIIDELQITGKEEERIKKSIDTAAKQGNGCFFILDKNIDASPKSFAVLEIVEIEGNSLLTNQWVDSLADIKEQVISKANEQRGQWQLNVKQEIDKLIAEKKLEDYKLQQKKINKRNFILGLVLMILGFSIPFIICLYLDIKNSTVTMILWGGLSFILLSILKKIFPKAFDAIK